jgi:hypothetical protein
MVEAACGAALGTASYLGPHARRVAIDEFDATLLQRPSNSIKVSVLWRQRTDLEIDDDIAGLEYRLDDDPPRAARDFVLPFVTLYDAAIACWEAKYTYWAIRPFQLDPEIKPVFATPNHPSYPPAHACSSIAVTRMLGHLFPRDTEAFATLGERTAESRIWAGIHYRSDIVAGRQLALAVADKVIERAKKMGGEP